MTSIAVWTPALTSSFSDKYVESVINLQKECMSRGIGFSWSSIGKSAMLPAIRNKCVHEFLKSHATHMLFIDSDIGVGSQDIIDCVLSGLEFTSLPYCQRHIDPTHMVKSIKSIEPVDMDKINSLLSKPTHQHDLKYPINEKALLLGYKRVDAVGAGATIMSRSVFEKLSDVVGEYIDFHTYANKPETIKNFFRYSIDLDGNYVSEDYAFCYTWTSIGGEIYIKEDAVTSHTGSVDYIYDKEVL